VHTVVTARVTRCTCGDTLRDARTTVSSDSARRNQRTSRVSHCAHEQRLVKNHAREYAASVQRKAHAKESDWNVVCAACLDPPTIELSQATNSQCRAKLTMSCYAESTRRDSAKPSSQLSMQSQTNHVMLCREHTTRLSRTQQPTLNAEPN
jgi:hypothetical protein